MYVFGLMNGINMQHKSTIKILGNLGNGHEAQNVYDSAGIAPTVRENYGKITRVMYDPYNRKVQKNQENANSLRTNHTNGNTWVMELTHGTSNMQQKYTRRILAPNNFQHKAGDGTKTRKKRIVDIVPSLQANAGGTQQSYVIQETSEQSPQVKSPTTTSLPQDFHAKLLALLENAEDLMTPEELSSLKSQGYLKINSRSSLYLKMLKDFYLMTTETLSRPSSPRLQNWGMTFNGKCLTARISESHRIGKECSLSDILEDNPDQKYFLSEQAIQRMNLKGYSPTLSIQATGGEQIETKSKQPFGQTSRIHKKEGISPTLPTPSGGHHIPMICESDD